MSIILTQNSFLHCKPQLISVKQDAVGAVDSITAKFKAVAITTWLYLVLMIVMVCFNIGICTYHESNAENAKKKYKMMEKMRNRKDCVISGATLDKEKGTVKELISNCNIFTCISTHDLTTQALCQFMWRKCLALSAYTMCCVTYYAAYLTLNVCKKRVTALINTDIGWSGARMTADIFETNECTANSFTANFRAMKHPITKILSYAPRLPARHVIPVKISRMRFFKKSSMTIMLAAMLIVSIIARSQAQQVSLEF